MIELFSRFQNTIFIAWDIFDRIFIKKFLKWAKSDTNTVENDTKLTKKYPRYV